MTKAKAVTPRKKPRQMRSMDTVKVILEAAASILEKEGFEGYNTNAVAARAGVSIGSLYQYFPNKDALTAALIDRETSVLLCDVQAAQKAPDGRLTLIEIVRAVVSHQTRRPALARLLDFEESRLPLRARNKRVTDKIHQAIVLCIEHYPATASHGASVVAHDLVAILRGVVDAAGERKEVRADALHARVERAVFGYLNYS